MFIAVFAVERLPVVQTQMGSKTVAGVESLITALLRTRKRLLLGVHADVDLQAVGRKEGLAASLLGALETVLAPVRLQVGLQVADRAVAAVATLVVASVPRQVVRIVALE